MKLNHINLIVAHVDEAARFFQTYFGFGIIEVKGDHIISVLKGTDGFTLVLMLSKSGHTAYPENFHIGFMLENEEQVNETWTKLRNGGIAIEHEPKKIRDSYGFYFWFENIMVEVGIASFY